MDHHNLAKKQGYGRTLGIGKKPALFISDMQNAYTDPNYVRGLDMSDEITIINTLIAHARKNDIPIIFSVIAFSQFEISHPSLWMQKVNGLADLTEDSKLTKINKNIHYDPNADKLIVKQFPSAFFSSSLATILINLKIDTLFIAGCMTSGCIRATAIDCLQYGFIPIIVEDGVADRWPTSHQQALYELKAKYADIMTSQQIIAHAKK